MALSAAERRVRGHQALTRRRRPSKVGRHLEHLGPCGGTAARQPHEPLPGAGHCVELDDGDADSRFDDLAPRLVQARKWPTRDLGQLERRAVKDAAKMEEITFRLTQAEALVLFEWLAKMDETGSAVANDAEQTVLWRIEAQLEKQLLSPLGPDYAQAVDAARREVLGPQ